jgi:protein dispatched 1
VKKFQQQLNKCRVYYPKSLTDLAYITGTNIPDDCFNRYLINTHKYLVDKFLTFDENDRGIVKYTAIYLSIIKYDKKFLMKLYNENLKPNNLELNSQYKISYNFNIKFEVFNDQIYNSLYFLIFTILIILIMSMIYLQSILLTIVILLCVIFSLFQSYFIYKIVFQLSFFPFMNITSVFLLVGLACDDVFVFYDTWLHANKLFKVENDDDNDFIFKCMKFTIEHAATSIFITSFTTAISFIVNLNSNIVTIKLFGLFACLAMILNFIFIIIFVPCVISLKYRYKDHCKCRIKLPNFFKKVYLTINNANIKFFQELLPNFIINCRYFLIFILIIIGICGNLFVFYKPGLSLPKSSTLKLFSDSNPLEHYDNHISVLSNTNGVFNYQKDSIPYLRVSYIFGLRVNDGNIDYGSFYQPDNLGTKLSYDKKYFNFYHEKAQYWLSKFCHSLKYSNESKDDIQSFELANKYKICLFDYLTDILAKPCNLSNQICCNQTSFPFRENILRYCLSNSTFLTRHFSNMFSLLYEKLYYDSQNGLIKVVEYQQITSFIWNANYEKMKKIYSKIDSSFAHTIKYSAYDFITNLDMKKNAFFTSDFDFYDLQSNLLNSTLTSFLISLFVVALIMLIATRGNLIVTFFAILSIDFAISSTVGTLALLKWELNIVESVTIILAIGLSIDFVVHFGIAYSQRISEPSENFKRTDLVKECVQQLGSSG